MLCNQSLWLLKEDVMASFRLDFKCHLSYSRQSSLSQKTMLKSEGQAIFGLMLGAMIRSLTLSRGAWILAFSKIQTIKCLWVALFEMKCGGCVILPLN